MQARRLGRLLGLGLLMTAIAGCGGFHLRGADSVLVRPLQGQRIELSGVPAESNLGQVLVAALGTAGAETVSSGAPWQLAILKVQEDKEVSGYSAVRQVREFNHFIEVSFQVKRVDQPAATPLEASVRAERHQIYDSRYVLGVAEEERSIRAELRAEAARLLAVRLGAIQP